MTLPRWDRIYYFVFIATILSVLGFLAMLVYPLAEIVEFSGDGETSRRVTLLANGDTFLLGAGLLPVLLTLGGLIAVPKDGMPDRSAKINLWISTFVVYLFVVWTIFSVGILFIPCAMFITAATVGAQVRRRQRSTVTTPGSMSGRGGGKQNRNK